MKALLADLVSQVKSISLSESTLPSLLKQEVIIDLEEVGNVIQCNLTESESSSGSV